MSGIDCSCKLVVVGNYESGKSQVILFYFFTSRFLCLYLFCILFSSKVIVNSTFLMFWATNKESQQQVPVTLYPNQVGRVVFSTCLEKYALIIYPSPNTIRIIREDLALTEESFRGLTINQKLSRIFLFIDNNEQTTELRLMLRTIFKSKIDELDFDEIESVLLGYQDLLPELPMLIESTKVKRVSVEVVREKPQPARIILRYPPRSLGVSSHGCVSIYSNDFLDLAPMTYLNDAIIDFYIKYLTLEVIDERLRGRIHAFDSFFYKKLTSVEEKDPTNPKDDLTAEQKAWNKYQRVAKWDEKVKLFEKDFIFVPINISEHWFLAVICFPYLDGRTLNYETEEEVDVKLDKDCRVKQSCILIFDSLGIDRSNVSKELRIYLRQRFLAEHDGTKICDFSSKVMPGCYVKVPRQANYFDCGIFVLQYVESFLLNPIRDFRTPIKGLEKWFSQATINKKREDLKDLIESLVQKYEPTNLPLPKIDFNCNMITDLDTMMDEIVVEIGESPISKQEAADKDWTATCDLTSI